MTLATGTRLRPAIVLCALLSATLLAACTRSVDPTMGMVPPAEIGPSTGPVEDAVVSLPPVAGVGVSAVPPAGSFQTATPLISAATMTPRAGAGGEGPIQFLPVVGAPPQKVGLLSDALGRSAAESGVAILPSGGSVAPRRLKGYLSALSEGPETVVVYVWDVVDPAGNRVNRIQGQHRVAATAADPWDAVDAAALAAIAEETIDAFLRQGSASG
ncbi:MAG: hypothetical protein H7Y08_02075 [Rhizobiaceae bacterium]|nr:hypothetical protein [Rhizobiaceae bacterium]